MRKIIIDTDIGGDIDDAFALVLALNSPELELIGVTTVFTDLDRRTQLALKLLEVFGHGDIPVAKGSERSLIGSWDPALDSYQSNILKNRVPYNCSKNAADFIVDAVMKEEGVTLVAIGPLTNIALAILKEPQVVKRSEIILMGGMVTCARPEWNILCDPEAARIVFESGMPLTMVGLDVTERCSFSRQQADRIISSADPKTRFLAGILELFLERCGFLPVLHDPLALSLLIWPELVKLEKKVIRIETRGEFTRGVTVDCTGFYGQKSEKESTLVCTDVDAAVFVERLLEKLVG